MVEELTKQRNQHGKQVAISPKIYLFDTENVEPG
jgi:hypothetical protein